MGFFVEISLQAIYVGSLRIFPNSISTRDKSFGQVQLLLLVPQRFGREMVVVIE